MQPNHDGVHPETPTAYPVASGHHVSERKPSMSRLKQGLAAVTLVASLGLVVPSTFGGPASADPVNNPNAFETTLKCKIGDEIVPYDVVTTGAAASFQDMNSATVFI